jgi:hypothetical protein
MGMQKPSSWVTRAPNGGRDRISYVAKCAAPLVLALIATGCSLSASNPSSAVQPASVPPPPGTSTAAVRSAPDPSLMPYPTENLFDYSFGSKSTAESPSQPDSRQAVAMPHPPGTYTPSAQPYSPPGQAAAGAPAGSTVAAQNGPPPPPASIDTGAYPNKSFLDLFKSQ